MFKYLHVKLLSAKITLLTFSWPPKKTITQKLIHALISIRHIAQMFLAFNTKMPEIAMLASELSESSN